MVGQIQKLGPLGMPQRFEEWDKEMERFAARVAAQEAESGCACGAQTQEMEPAHA